ncbi:hypothetical protein LguiB_028352 [Lonicera macranthoides]
MKQMINLQMYLPIGLEEDDNHKIIVVRKKTANIFCLSLLVKNQCLTLAFF